MRLWEAKTRRLRGRGCAPRISSQAPDSLIGPSRLEDLVPTISRFMGITITMYFDDHAPPHFHARAAERAAKIRIDTLEVIGGNLRQRELRLVLAWAEMYAEELRFNWRRACAGTELHAIEPLR